MKKNQQASTKPFTVLHQTKRHLVVQTHAGEALNQDDQTSPANFGAFNLGMHVGQSYQGTKKSAKAIVSHQ